MVDIVIIAAYHRGSSFGCWYRLLWAGHIQKCFVDVWHIYTPLPAKRRQFSATPAPLIGDWDIYSAKIKQEVSYLALNQAANRLPFCPPFAPLCGLSKCPPAVESRPFMNLLGILPTKAPKVAHFTPANATKL